MRDVLISALIYKFYLVYHTNHKKGSDDEIAAADASFWSLHITRYEYGTIILRDERMSHYVS